MGAGKLLFATSNPHKVAEARPILAELGWEVERVALEYPEIRSQSVEEVARAGARHVADLLLKPVIVEDTGLFVRALGWFPGTYAKYVLNTIGKEGVLRLMEGVEDRYAEFRCAVGFSEPGGEPLAFLGVAAGSIAQAPAGSGGFGYDPIFVPQGHGLTYAEMDEELKNSLSHRRRALEAFAAWAREGLARRGGRRPGARAGGALASGLRARAAPRSSGAFPGTGRSGAGAPGEA